MVTFITLPYLLLMLSSNFNINGCRFFILHVTTAYTHNVLCKVVILMNLFTVL